MSMTPAAIQGLVSDIMPSLPMVPTVDYTSRDYQSILNDMVALIPTYLPEWTDRSPGDFGIVLMEIFAYMADILNFYNDRIANEAYLATARQAQSVLNIAYLLDYTPHGNVSATCQLQFTIVQPSAQPVQIPAGTQVSTTQLGTPVYFETNQVLTIWGDSYSPPESPITVTSNGTANQSYTVSGWYQGAYAKVFAYDGQTQTVKVNNVTWTLAPGNTFASSAPGDHVYITAPGNVIQFGNGVVSPASGHGLIPPNGQPIEIDFYAAPPNQYTALTDATQGFSVVEEALGSSSGAPNQSFSLFRTPVVDTSQYIYVDEGTGPYPWTYFPRIVDAYDTSTAYTLKSTASGVVTIQFGDGINGRIPVPGSPITATYMVGGGAVGNVPAHTLSAFSTAVAGVISVTNPAQAAGGADAESLDHIRIHAPLSLTAVNRAVTVDDYAALCLTKGAIAKASAISSNYNAITVYIHPAGDFIFDIPTLQSRVQALAPSLTNSSGNGFLDTKKLATVGLTILPPQYNKLWTTGGLNLSVGYVPVNITVNPLQVLPQYHTQAVVNDVTAAISKLLAFDAVDFGSRLSLSQIYHTIQDRDGVDYCVVQYLYRAEVAATLGDVTTGPYEIPTIGTITVTPSGGISY